jgi:hypothetical protein
MHVILSPRHWHHGLMVLTVLLFTGCASSPPAASGKTGPIVASKKAPGPLAGKTMTQICMKDGLLLSRWSVTALYGTPLPEPCCAKGVLPTGEEHRCSLDWPSSGIPSCDIWLKLHQKLAAYHPAPAGRSTLVQKNLAQLASWSKTRHGCE